MQDNKSISIIARTAFAFACAPLAVGKLAIILATLVLYHSTISAKADSCPSIRDEINTDRPDVTNFSVVTPPGSLQIENGVNFSARGRSSYRRHEYALARRNYKLSRSSRGYADVLCKSRQFQKFRFFRCSTGAEVADQPSPRKSRSLRGVWCGIADGIGPHSRPRRAALFAIPVVMGVAQRVGIEWNVHRVLSSL